MSQAYPLIVEDVKKAFAGRQILEGISFSLEKPQVVALLGANGIGKSTLFRILAGFLPADSGEILLNGISLEEAPEAARRTMGYLPENAPSHPGFRVREALEFTAAAQGLSSGKARREAVERVLEECSLKDVQDRICDHLSKGYRRRLGMAQALVHDPPLLMLDEPTDGLDPIQKNTTRNLLKELGARKTVLVSTHLLEEVPLVCSRVLLLKGGRIDYDGPVPPDLREKFFPQEGPQCELPC